MKNTFKTDDSIASLLHEKVRLEKQLENILSSKGFPHFSSKKFVGNLGEYYAKLNLEHLFIPNTLIISEKSNEEFDLKGTLQPEVAIKWGISQEVKIEVKTRYHQLGSPHLFGLKKGKFDLLVFVSLNEDYSVHCIGVLKAEDIQSITKKEFLFLNILQTYFILRD